MAALLYLIMKFSVLRYKNSFQRSLVFGPIVFGLAYGIMCLALVWKGTPKLGCVTMAAQGGRRLRDAMQQSTPLGGSEGCTEPLRP